MAVAICRECGGAVSTRDPRCSHCGAADPAGVGSLAAAGATPIPGTPRLAPCRVCRHQVSTDALTCPQCGAPDPSGERSRAVQAAAATAQQQKSNAAKGCGIGCLGLLGVMVLFAALGGGDDSAGGSSAEARINGTAVGAWVACQDFVSRRLKAPGTADFPGVYSDHVAHVGSGRYQVRASVDAENSFGAKLRSNFDCTVQYQASDESWGLVSLQME
jgi:RNA polymerase subunit RPABC4/transcription elongation factor Spt4